MWLWRNKKQYIYQKIIFKWGQDKLMMNLISDVTKCNVEYKGNMKGLVKENPEEA